MALNTEKKITRRSWDVIHMPDVVMAHVNAVGTDQHKQPFFTDRRGCPIGDVEIPGVMDFEEEDDDDAKMPVLDPAGIGGVELQEWMLQGRPHKPLRLMILTFHNPIHL
jgi:hypothetical protein